MSWWALPWTLYPPAPETPAEGCKVPDPLAAEHPSAGALGHRRAGSCPEARDGSSSRDGNCAGIPYTAAVESVRFQGRGRWVSFKRLFVRQQHQQTQREEQAWEGTTGTPTLLSTSEILQPQLQVHSHRAGLS